MLREEELRAADEVLRTALHQRPISDAEWTAAAATYQAGRTFGAFDGAELIGTASSFHTRTLVPGGARLPTCAVARVGVRPDRTRRGVLSALKRDQLDAAVRNGETLAQLRASEARIYGRFGYGVAARHAVRKLDRARAAVAARGAPEPLRLLNAEAAVEALPPIYARHGPHRAGMIERPQVWWAAIRSRLSRNDWKARTVLHGAPGAEDGFASYWVESTEGRSVLSVLDFHAGNAAAYRALWQYLLDVDLVDEVRTEMSPMDDPVELLLADRRACSVAEVADEIWLRLVDVPDALAQRSYGAAEPVTIEVTDALLPANNGCYRITADGANKTTDEPDLRMGVDMLGALYLGDLAASLLATAGRIEVIEPAALARADVLLGTATAPWCGTFF